MFADRPIEMIVGLFLGFVIGTTFHEFMHAYSAHWLGDDTAQREGRITLNPAAHFDPIGFILGVLLIFGVGFIAWGKPVPVNPYALRFGKRGMAIVAIAGPLANIAFAIVLTIVYRFGGSLLPANILQVIFWMIWINLALFSFNLIPIPPLDGFNILVGILPNYWTLILEPLRRYSIPILLVFVLFLPYLGDSLGRAIPGFELRPVSEAVIPVISLLARLLGIAPLGL